jgi:hypothetical protein
MVVENTRNGEVGDGVDSGYYDITYITINGNEVIINYNEYGDSEKSTEMVATFNQDPRDPGSLKTPFSLDSTPARSDRLLDMLKEAFLQDTDGFKVYEQDEETGRVKNSDYGRLFEKLNSIAVQLNPEAEVETSDIEVKLLANGDVEEVSAAIPLGEGLDMVEGFSVEGGRVSGLFSYNVYNNGDLGPVSQLDQARENPEYKLFDFL